MQSQVRTVRRNDQVDMADALMHQERIRHLPVIDEDGLVCAVVSQRDLFRSALVRGLGYGTIAQDRILRQIAVKEAMSSEVHTTTPQTPIAEAARTMIERRIGCLPVLEGDRLVGILTETDLVRLVADGKAP